MTIHGKVRATFAIQVVLIALMAGAALVSYSEFRTASGNLDLARQANILELECRRREKDFLLEEDATKAQFVTSAGKELLGTLQRLSETSSIRAQENVHRAADAISDYLIAFDALKEMDEHMGMTDELGLRGHMREKVHAAEAEMKKTKASALIIGMLSMRRDEKDFLLRHDTVSVQKHADAAQAFFQELAAEELPADVRDSIKQSMDDYVKSFNVIVADYPKFDASLQRAKASAHSTEPLFKEMVTNFENEMNSARSFASILIASIAIISLILGAVMGLLISARLKWIITQLSDSIGNGSEQVASACKQVAAASQQLAEGASEQASSIEETSSSLEEMSSMTKQNAGNAVQARGLAEKVREAADDGEKKMDDMNRAMSEIKAASDDVGKIIKTIDEIAFQTNLLALNAAVEAARAGDAGRGFAVVAEEVRSLAQRSVSAARESAARIETAIVKTNIGVETAKKVAIALGEMSVNVRKANDLIGEIAAASQEQSQGIEQVNLAVQQMDKVVQSNAANAEETASASEELTAQAETLQASVDLLVGSASSGDSARSNLAKAESRGLANGGMHVRRAVSTRPNTSTNGHNGLAGRSPILHGTQTNAALERVRKSAEDLIPMGTGNSSDEFKRF